MSTTDQSRVVAQLTVAGDLTLETVSTTLDSGLLRVFYRLAGCQMIECVELTDELTMWVDEEGLYEPKPVNPIATVIAECVGVRNQGMTGGGLVDLGYRGDVVFAGGADEEGETLGLSGKLVADLRMLVDEARRVAGIVGEVGGSNPTRA